MAKPHVHYKGAATHTERIYCVKCREYCVVTAPELVTFTTPKGIRYSLIGTCPHDGTRVYRIISKVKALELAPDLA